ncbi:MAG TPA: lysophospholipid acyltransferase family protein [Candidatus Krumholzibacteria bacterium]|nr:lysophospholipid acyltransferase family protein [Candidatus Krumholzibacteria bacterium]
MKWSLVIVPPIGAAVIRAIAATWRYSIRGREHLDAAREQHPRVVYAFWHGRLLPLAYLHRGTEARVLASEHHDGEMLARTIRYLGLGHVKGSSTRGGTKAILGLADAVRAGYDVALTVDGPRGPRFQVKPGVVEVAKLTGVSIVPVTAASRRHRTFRSWDAFELPRPFTRVLVEYGPPVRVAADAGREAQEAARVELEAVLRRMTEACDHDVRAQA